MPLSELVLNTAEAQEIRLTDEPVAVGDTLDVEGTYWEVVRELSRLKRDHARFQCRRASAMKLNGGEMRSRAEATRARHEELCQRVRSRDMRPADVHDDAAAFYDERERHERTQGRPATADAAHGHAAEERNMARQARRDEGAPNDAIAWPGD